MQVCVNRQLVWWYDVFKLLQMYLLILTVSLHCRLSLLISLCLRQQRPNPSQSENWLSRKRDGNARWVLSSPPISNNFVAEGIWHCVWYVTQYQHMPCMLYFNLALPLGNAVPSISCWLSCICTPKRMLYHAEYLGMMMKSERWCISGWRHSQATPPAPDETMK